MSPQRSLDISDMVLQVASKYLERGILFLIRDGKASGLGGFGLAKSDSASVELAKKLVLDVQEAKPLAEVVRTRRGLRIKQDVNGLNGSLFASIGRGRAKESPCFPCSTTATFLLFFMVTTRLPGNPWGNCVAWSFSSRRREWRSKMSSFSGRSGNSSRSYPPSRARR